MANCRQLDVACRPRFGKLILVILLIAFGASAYAQEALSDAARLAAVKKAYDAGQWEEVLRVARGPENQSPELDLIAGLAFAKLQHWEEARAALEAGQHKAPSDARFPVELAGVYYKQHEFPAAKRDLQLALRLNPQDAYVREFLGTIYFIEGNLDAALKYWNPINQPRLHSVSVTPPPQLDKTLLDRAIGFNAPQVLTADALLAADGRLDALGIYPHQRFVVAPSKDGTYDATFHMPERGGLGDSILEGALTTLGGLPYQTVYPSFYDLGHKAVNLTSLLRWDSEKRRAYVDFSTPVLDDPALRFRAYFDGRNENWNLTNTFFAGGSPLSNLNIRQVAAGAELLSVVSGQWSWTTGFEIANRNFRNLVASSTPEKAFFTGGTSLNLWLATNRSLMRVPERRFTVDSSAEANVGRNFAGNLGVFGGLRGSIGAHWLPKAQGDDYEAQVKLRAGATFGEVPLDQLFQLGVERDNDLWLRGHAGTIEGRKGDAPLGRRFFLLNSEVYKNIYSNGFWDVQLGPFLDNGEIADPSGLFGSRGWLWDTGAQCKIRLLGSVTVVLIYGRDLRGGRNIFYGTVVH